MKIAIIGGGNMGGAIARGLIKSEYITPENLYVINRREAKAKEMLAFNSHINVPVNDYSSIKNVDIVILAIKPWMVEDWIKNNRQQLTNPNQIFISVAAGITINNLKEWIDVNNKPIYMVIPNTAIEVMESMTFINGHYTEQYDSTVTDMFNAMGKAVIIDEKMMPAAMALCSCGIAFAFRYIRACMEGGVEMGLYPHMAKELAIQTIRGAADLLEHTGSHPEEEVDKVTTAGGITIKGLNELEHAGFSSAVIKALKACK